MFVQWVWGPLFWNPGAMSHEACSSISHPLWTSISAWSGKLTLLVVGRKPSFIFPGSSLFFFPPQSPTWFYHYNCIILEAAYFLFGLRETLSLWCYEVSLTNGFGGGKGCGRGTEKRGLHHDYTSWWSIYDFPTITLALASTSYLGKKTMGKGGGKKKKLIPPQTGHSLFNYMSCRLYTISLVRYSKPSEPYLCIRIFHHSLVHIYFEQHWTSWAH